jgi:hypothetical protein
MLDFTGRKIYFPDLIWFIDVISDVKRRVTLLNAGHISCYNAIDSSICLKWK